MNNSNNQSLKSTALLLLMTLFLHSVHSLNIGIQSSAISVSRQCSRKCESQFCTVAPFLRYGKYCGILYSGCRGERPCDGLDACCKIHDDCVQSRHTASFLPCGLFDDYLSQHCNQNFLNCITKFKNSGAPTFRGINALQKKLLTSSLWSLKLLLWLEGFFTILD
ncbi:Phospholipase A2-alpha [Acorus calamus]|uniref:phospholipase A2 n=1 Tax=Acorus calamus TaxID=4465 RepID=A0AAV9CFF6_ACOCL|nr:Phospholipase A2-alpha [Acorus calamus]